MASVNFPGRPFLAISCLIAGLLMARASHALPAGEIEKIAAEYVPSGEVPGVIIGIWTGDSEMTVIRKGVSNLTSHAPMEPINSQRIGSITKSFVVTRILQLADAGRLSLDDPIGKFVPDLKNGDATLRELANMTSGIFNYTEDMPFVMKFISDLTRSWTNKELVAVANRHAPYFPPGRRWYYSNTNTILLGMAVQRVTGNPLRDELTRHILRPLGLDHTLYPTSIQMPQPFNSGYALLGPNEGLTDVTALNPSALSGSGAMISTLGDLNLWGKALADGRLVSPTAQAERLRMIRSSDGVGPFYNRYGLGMGAISGWLGHTGELPGFQNLVMHNLVANQTVVIFVNGAVPHLHLPTVIFRRIAPLLEPAQPTYRTTAKVFGKRNFTTGRARIRLRGSAASKAGVLLVEISSRSRVQAAKGTRRWQSMVRLRPGRNSLSIRATDRLGNRSPLTRVRVTRL